MTLIDMRCTECNKLLAKIAGLAEIVCPRCKTMNKGETPSVQSDKIGIYRENRIIDHLLSELDECNRQAIEDHGYPEGVWVYANVSPKVFHQMMSEADANLYIKADPSKGCHTIGKYLLAIDREIEGLGVVRYTPEEVEKMIKQYRTREPKSPGVQ